MYCITGCYVSSADVGCREPASTLLSFSKFIFTQFFVNGLGTNAHFKCMIELVVNKLIWGDRCPSCPSVLPQGLFGTFVPSILTERFSMVLGARQKWNPGIRFFQKTLGQGFSRTLGQGFSRILGQGCARILGTSFSRTPWDTVALGSWDKIFQNLGTRLFQGSGDNIVPEALNKMVTSHWHKVVDRTLRQCVPNVPLPWSPQCPCHQICN